MKIMIAKIKILKQTTHLIVVTKKVQKEESLGHHRAHPDPDPGARMFAKIFV